MNLLKQKLVNSSISAERCPSTSVFRSISLIDIFIYLLKKIATLKVTLFGIIQSERMIFVTGF